MSEIYQKTVSYKNVSGCRETVINALSTKNEFVRLCILTIGYSLCPDRLGISTRVCILIRALTNKLSE